MELKPWDYLSGEEYCQLILDKTEMPVLIAVIGDVLLEEFGFIICPKTIESHYLLSFKENIQESELSKLRRYQHYALFYKHYLELNEEEEAWLQEYLPLDENSFYPILKHHVWANDESTISTEELEEICFILENLYMLLKNLALGKLEKNKPENYEIPSRLYNPKTKLYDNRYCPFLVDIFLIKPEFKFIQETATMYKNLETNSLTVEFDLLYLPLKMDEGQLLAAYALYDVKKNELLEMNIINSKDERIMLFVDTYLALVKKYGIFKEVRCRDSIDQKLLESLNIPQETKYLIKELKRIDQEIDSLVEKYN